MMIEDKYVVDVSDLGLYGITDEDHVRIDELGLMPPALKWDAYSGLGICWDKQVFEAFVVKTLHRPVPVRVKRSGLRGRPPVVDMALLETAKSLGKSTFRATDFSERGDVEKRERARCRLEQYARYGLLLKHGALFSFPA